MNHLKVNHHILKMTIKVISYNILSPFLCHDGEFIGYNAGHLQWQSRKQLLFNYLQKWIEDSPIICLQEISFNWKGKLEEFFRKNNYTFFTMNYGHKSNGFFGVGIAIPDQYSIKNTEYLHMGSIINANPPEHIYNWFYQQKQTERKKEEDKLSFVDRVAFLMEELVESKEDEIQKIQDTINEAKNRNNFAIGLTLETKDEVPKQFMIYNYHMPCTFKKPVIQAMHIDAIKKLIIKNKQVPTIFAGDFNVTPDSDGYNYLTSPFLQDEHRIYIPVGNHSDIALKSAFKEIGKEEPNFTCFSHTKFGGEFKNTLDYIFFHGSLQASEAERLILTSTKMPNQSNPSDHLPLTATFQL